IEREIAPLRADDQLVATRLARIEEGAQRPSDGALGALAPVVARGIHEIDAQRDRRAKRARVRLVLVVCAVPEIRARTERADGEPAREGAAEVFPRRWIALDDPPRSDRGRARRGPCRATDDTRRLELGTTLGGMHVRRTVVHVGVTLEVREALGKGEIRVRHLRCGGRRAVLVRRGCRGHGVFPPRPHPFPNSLLLVKRLELLALLAAAGCAGQHPPVLIPVRIDSTRTAAAPRATPSPTPAGSSAGVRTAEMDPLRRVDRMEWPGPNIFRSGSGAPGPEYWQQRADYTIAATLDTAQQRVSGVVTIRYTNNSPDSLRFV